MKKNERYQPEKVGTMVSSYQVPYQVEPAVCPGNGNTH